MMSLKQFDFGRNWKDFSDNRMGQDRLQSACDSLRDLIGTELLQGRTVLDIGCGSGLFAIAALRCGASRVVGLDINPTSVEVSRTNCNRLIKTAADSFMPEFHVNDILDPAGCERWGKFDIVYSWGVLHHTGRMWDAIRNAAGIVKDGGDGLFVIAIYNRHWTSPIWKQIKRFYNISPRFIRHIMHVVLGAVIYLGVWVTTRQNPLRKDRGMDFWYDVIDWLGGYPYEYASASEVIPFLEGLGFRLKRLIPTAGWTGCNQYVFERHE